MSCCYVSSTGAIAQWKVWLNVSVTGVPLPISANNATPLSEYTRIDILPPTERGNYKFDSPVVVSNGKPLAQPAPCRPLNATGASWVCLMTNAPLRNVFAFAINTAEALPPDSIPAVDQVSVFVQDPKDTSIGVDDAAMSRTRSTACTEADSSCPKAPDPVSPSDSGSNNSLFKNNSSGLSPTSVTLIAIFVSVAVLSVLIVVFLRLRNNGSFKQCTDWWHRLSTDDHPRAQPPPPPLSQTQPQPEPSKSTTSSDSAGSTASPSKPTPIKRSQSPVVAMEILENVSKAKTGASRAVRINPLAFNRSIHAVKQHSFSRHATATMPRQGGGGGRVSPSESVSTMAFSVLRETRVNKGHEKSGQHGMSDGDEDDDNDDDDVPLGQMKRNAAM
ncbi:hypothetical protein HDU77_003798 [Chytriomyces hyalinus]|nr:hypothetical protein HDU77_003798 [Chytriomyces hyalinus]